MNRLPYEIQVIFCDGKQISLAKGTTSINFCYQGHLFVKLLRLCLGLIVSCLLCFFSPHCTVCENTS